MTISMLNQTLGFKDETAQCTPTWYVSTNET